MVRSILFAIACMFCVTSLIGQTTAYRSLDDLKQEEGFKKLLKRGKIPAIYKPTFIAGKDADMPDDAWVIGVYHKGEAQSLFDQFAQ